MVPNEWGYKKLGVVAELQRGFDLPSAKRLEGSVPIISSGGLSGYHNEAKVKAPGIVTGRYGSIGEVFFVQDDFWPLNTSLWVKNFHGNDPKFIYYLLSNFDFKKFSDKTGVPGVNRNDLHAVKVGVPPLPEQRKIAKILSKWDKAITITEKLIEISKQHKKALMQQLLGGRKRLLNPETGKVFEGKWEEVRLSEIVEVSNTKSVKSDEFPVITSSRKGIYLQEEYFKKQVASEDNTGYKLVPRGYITYRAMSDDGLFRFNIQDILDDSIISPAYGVFKFKESCDRNFCLEVMNSKQNMSQIRRLSQGGTRISFKTSSFNEINFVLPNLIEQQKIASVLTSADKKNEVLVAKLAHFKQEKKALMQQLLTGKRRVKVDDMEVVK
ncbi:hypothetical protein BCV33_14530 [Vibrio lentus]|uniref:restriction endonuclease subunit S n=1 Tax=Vibrio lentus TaxID=136468 RepID=UPI000C84F62D|nr:restriction endonuclease subunit S [Vibrio lentus]PME65682.1 hypothetical protein BCV33_14530 [Vibrio lentus]